MNLLKSNQSEATKYWYWPWVIKKLVLWSWLVKKHCSAFFSEMGIVEIYWLMITGGWRSQIRKICSNLKMTKNVKKDQICTFFSQKWQKYAKLTKRLLFRKVFNSDNCFYHNPRDTTNQNNQFSNTKIWISNLHLKCRFCVSEN